MSHALSASEAIRCSLCNMSYHVRAQGSPGATATLGQSCQSVGHSDIVQHTAVSTTLLLHDRESEQLRQQLVQAVSELQAAQQEASEALAAARERQKRFTMLNATFRRKEEALVGRAEQAEAASSQAVSDSAEAKLMAAQAKQVRPPDASRLLSQEHQALYSGAGFTVRCAGHLATRQV